MVKIVCLIVLSVLIAVAPEAWADDAPGTIVSELVVTAKPQPTALSGLVVAAKPRTSPVSGVEVSPAKKCLEPRSPPDPGVPAPKLVSTYPAKDQVVRPGLLVVRLTFDLPMACRGSLKAAAFTANPCTSDKAQNWILSYDRRNLRILCEVRPGKRYRLSINSHAGEDFQGLGGRKPTTSELTFATSGEPEVSTIEEAVDQDPTLGPTAKPAH